MEGTVENMKRIKYYKEVPANIKRRTRENINKWNLSLYDAFNEACREFAIKGTELYNAWNCNDFREYIPQVYNEEYLDFKKYPLKYCK